MIESAKVGQVVPMRWNGQTYLVLVAGRLVLDDKTSSLRTTAREGRGPGGAA